MTPARPRRDVPTAVVAAIGAMALLVLGAGVVRIATHRADLPGVPLALASPEGVSLVGLTGDPIVVSTAPAAVAYGVGSDFVVFHDRGEGPVQVWSAGAVRDLPMGQGRPYVTLIDAGVAGGVPYALVSEHSRATSPSTSFEEVVRIGLRDRSRTTLLRRPAWESGYGEARLLPGGDVVGLMHSLAYASVLRWSPLPAGAHWETPLGEDTDFNLLLHEGTPWTVTFRFDRARGRTPVLSLTRFDPASGRAARPLTVDVVDPGRTIASELSCHDWLTSTELACGRRDGSPVAVSVVDESFRACRVSKARCPGPSARAEARHGAPTGVSPSS